MLLIAKIIIFRLLGIRQGIHTITGRYDAKKQITLPIALKCYVLGTACTNSIHQMEAALVTDKTAAGFKLHGSYNEGYPWNVEADFIVIGFN